MWQQVFELFQAAFRSSELKEQLLNVKSGKHFVQLAASKGYQFTLGELVQVLTSLKSGELGLRFSINNETGDSFVGSYWGRICVLEWVVWGEELGLVRPFCNLDNSGAFLSKDMLEPNWEWFDQCCLPRGYFCHVLD